MNEAARTGSASEATAWHAIAADEVVRRLDSDTTKGLDVAEATRRLQTYGPNRLPEAGKQGPLRPGGPLPPPLPPQCRPAAFSKQEKEKTGPRG